MGKLESLFLPKALGGLGFKDLSSFNQALLAKQGWRLLENPNSVAFKILKVKYFKGEDFLSAKLKLGGLSCLEEHSMGEATIG